MLETKESVYNFLIEDIIKEILSNKREDFFNVEKAFKKISKKHNLEIVDAYCSLRGKYLDYPEFFIPNTYGQEDDWFKDEFDFVMLFENEVISIIYKNEKVNIRTIPFELKINLDDFGGKRGYYLTDELVRFRTNKEFYNTLPDSNKYKEGERDISGPHFTIRFEKTIED